MFISPGNYDQAYEQIKQDALKGDTTVQMLVASNVDAMCAAKMLMVRVLDAPLRRRAPAAPPVAPGCLRSEHRHGDG